MDRNKVKLTNKVRFIHVHQHFYEQLRGSFDYSKQWLKSSKSKNCFLKKLSDTVEVFILHSNRTFSVIQ